jgi:predicted GNAT superfamily acetyltransferase
VVDVRDDGEVADARDLRRGHLILDYGVRLARSSNDLEAVACLQAEIWGAPEVAAPSTLLKAMASAGGIVLLATARGGPVGFAYGFTGRSATGLVYHRSHAAGVIASCRDSGVGRALKLAQRRRALAQGLELMVWTFDPGQSRNAHFNLNRLGAVARRFHRDYYGTRTDPLNQGRPSDRLVVEWYLDAARARAVDRARRRPLLLVPVPATLLRANELPDMGPSYRLLRRGLESAFRQSLAAVDFSQSDGGYWFAPLPRGFSEPVE